ncbi:multidrug ABC transporter ATP-binding protein [Embleya scabrispora]|uniref:Multidrug ABC transporter ATP-binding protein n=1 Tax=Embleya scabrispora TaxID=159449 RepID=A0A1T3P6S3_9ACTN|nr:multidrug ABC transporter ATP-binding protein [Embleya scabrispora]
MGLVVVLQLIQTLATLYLPTLNADLINHGVIEGDTGYILRVGGTMIGVTLVQIVCAAFAVYFGARIAMGVGRDIRSAVFDRVQTFSAREVGRFGAPSLITRTTNDVQQVQMLALLTLTLMVSAPIMCFGGILMAVNQDVPMSLLFLLIVPALILAVGWIVRAMPPLFRTLQGRIDNVNRIMREQITGIRVIRAFGRDGHEQARYADANADIRDVSLSVGRLMAFMYPSVLLVWETSAIVIVWIGGHRIGDGSMDIGALVAFLSYLMQILTSVMMATFMTMMIPRAAVCADRITEVLDTETSLTVSKAPVTALHAHGRLELRDVSFCYPGAEEPVLRGIDLIARPGETTAVIGSTGAGKTTLLGLIPRLLDVTGGSVLIGGVDTREIEAGLLSRTVGLVPQKPYLFSGTVASNLRYGNPDATDEELWRALEIAQARDFVEALPEKLDAPIAQGGGNVSGGQRQRLAIARLLVVKPEIYLFDDSFSALDYATDAALRAALLAETAEATVVIVAQRVATIRHADRIVVLDEGRVVGTGTHTELMAGNDTYREIVLSQLTEEEAA